MEKILQNNSAHEFSEQELYGIALTTGYALKNESLLNQIRAEAKNFLGNEEATACKIAVSSISMLNSYYQSQTCITIVLVPNYRHLKMKPQVCMGPRQQQNQWPCTTHWQYRPQKTWVEMR